MVIWSMRRSLYSLVLFSIISTVLMCICLLSLVLPSRGGGYPGHVFPDSDWSSARVLFCRVFLLLSYDFLVISILVYNFCCGGVWYVFLWWLYSLNCAIIIIIIPSIIPAVPMIIIRFRLRCLFHWCKYRVGSVAVITHYCGICNRTVSSRISVNIVGLKCFGLHGGDRAWGVLSQEHSYELSG